jgi:hypothetical protein
MPEQSILDVDSCMKISISSEIIELSLEGFCQWTPVFMLAFDIFIALRLDFAWLRGDTSRYDVKQVCDCGCTETEHSEHLLLRS